MGKKSNKQIRLAKKFMLQHIQSRSAEMIEVSMCDDSREQDPISQAGYRGHKFRQHLSFERQLQRDIEKPMKFVNPRIDQIR